MLVSKRPMIAGVDLNALPEDDDKPYDRHVPEYTAPGDRIESAISIANRERDERRKRLKKEHAEEGAIDQFYQTKHIKPCDKSRLPSGWLDCPAYGREIDCFIPSKVPLDETFNDCIPPGKRYSFKRVIRDLGRKLGLIIDLTNTTRYYSPSDLKNKGIQHVKIACVGRDAVPTNAQVNEFVYKVTRFLSHQKQSKKHILVHCTHGHNRTGYMIVHYLMRSTMMSVAQAIERFADARPPGIYKSDYIDALYSYYHEEKPDTAVCPPTPEWKRSSELDLNGEAMPDEDDDGNMAAAAIENHEPEARMSNDDVLGDEIPTDQAFGFRNFCYQTLKLNACPRRGMQFPGSHPVSLNRENLQLLRQRYYYATWKADGTRYMMLITMDGCYLVDRKFNFRRVQMRFPCRTSDTHHYTLLDGEMIIDTLPDSHKQERRYLIYDVMAINQVCVVERPFHERWEMIEKEIIDPRTFERKNISRGRNPLYKYEWEPFGVRRKAFWVLSTVPKLLKEFIPKLPHESDGLIFQGWDDPYVPRTHEGLLKWKYAGMNSVDFLFEVDEEGHEMMFINEHGKKKLLERNRVVFDAGLDPSTFSGKIIECSWNNDEQVWVCMRTRVDKNTPNDINTYGKVMRSIMDNITEDVLLGEVGDIIRLPMYADRIKTETFIKNKK